MKKPTHISRLALITGGRKRTLAFAWLLALLASGTQAQALDSAFVAASPLRIEVPQNRSFVLGGVGQSCALTQITPGRVSFPQVKIAWDGSGALRDVSLVLAFQHPKLESGQYLCEINRGEFDATFGLMGASLGPGQNIENLARCPLQCGGLKILAGASAFRAVGTLTVVGVMQRGSAQIPYQASTGVEFEYVP